MGRKKISIIVPVYNTGEYLHRCIKSIINNTYKDLEVICINDGSTDNSLEILNFYKHQDSRITIINKENGGIFSARNAGLDRATGDYVPFVDSDDWVHHQFFEILMHFLEISGCEIAICNYIATRENDTTEALIDIEKVHYSITTGDNIGLINDQMYGCVWRCLYKRKTIGDIRFPDLQIEDMPFQIKILGAGNGSLSLCHLDCQIYYYFQRNDSLIRQFNPRTKLAMTIYLVEHLKNSILDGERRLILLQVCRVFLSYRYGVMFDMDVELSKEIKATTKDLLKALAIPCGMSIKWRSIFTVMLMFPKLYRFYRIHDDPTLLQWETKKKKGEIPYGYISR